MHSPRPILLLIASLLASSACSYSPAGPGGFSFDYLSPCGGFGPSSKVFSTRFRAATPM